VRDGKWKAHLRQGHFKLYNLLADPSESNNLTDELPEISTRYRALLEDFEAKLPSDAFSR
jgi:hypothetical protein